MFLTESQRQRYDDTVRLLLSAGYFRARAPALKPFDKVSAPLAGGAQLLTAFCEPKTAKHRKAAAKPARLGRTLQSRLHCPERR